MPPAHVYRARRGGANLGRNAAIVAVFVVLLVVAWVAFARVRSIPSPRLTLTVMPTSSIAGTPLVLRPSLGAQEAVSLGGTDTIATAGADSPTPIASLTKMMSALVVLRDHPLMPGESGPELTVTAADVANYKSIHSIHDQEERNQGPQHGCVPDSMIGTPRPPPTPASRVLRVPTGRRAPPVALDPGSTNKSA